MKKNVLTILCCLCAMFIFKTQSNAQDSLIHYWHFNSFTVSMYTPTINAVPADYTLLPSANPRILYAPMPGVSSSYSTYCDNVALDATGPADYDTVNERMGQPNGNGFRTRNPSDSMYLYYYIPTTGFRNIVLTYAAEPSSIAHGMLQQIFDYSTDGGTTWKTTGLSIPSYSFLTPPIPLPAPDSNMQRITVTFTSDSAVNNNPNLVFRIHFSPTNTGTTGNNRFDNITVEGNPYPPSTGVSQLTSSSINYSIFPNPVTYQMDIVSELEGTKSIIISNAVGKKVFYGMAN